MPQFAMNNAARKNFSISIRPQLASMHVQRAHHWRCCSQALISPLLKVTHWQRLSFSRGTLGRLLTARTEVDGVHQLTSRWPNVAIALHDNTTAIAVRTTNAETDTPSTS